MHTVQHVVLQIVNLGAIQAVTLPNRIGTHVVHNVMLQVVNPNRVPGRHFDKLH